MRYPSLFNTSLNRLLDFDTEWDHFLPTPKFNPTGWVKTEEGLTASFDVPGLKKEDVKIEARNNLITISAEREIKTSNSVSKKQYYYQIYLPEGVTEESLEASLENGVLTLKAPAPEPQKKNKIIPIK